MAKQLQYYPDVPHLSIESCGEAMELRLESKSLDRQGWLRAMFFIDDRSKTVYIVDLFWKKTDRLFTPPAAGASVTEVVSVAPGSSAASKKPMNNSSHDCWPKCTHCFGSGFAGFAAELSKPPVTTSQEPTGTWRGSAS